MTQLELLLMKAPGLSEIEAKDLIKMLEGMEDLSEEILGRLKSSILERTGLLKEESDVVIELLMRVRNNK